MSDKIILSDSDLERAQASVSKILEALGQSVVGQEHLRKRLVTALMCDGHILLEGVPGLAKTLSIKALAQAVQADFKRIQFTPDLLPADLIGTEVFRPQEGRFDVRKGPVFANFVLADEINRAPAKVQSALLETMQEQQVTIGGERFEVPKPFFVLATQNPIEQEGTYPLPEAQVDRFLMKIKVSYPEPDQELRMIDLVSGAVNPEQNTPRVSDLAEVQFLKESCSQVYVDQRIKQYIVDLVWATREPARYQIKLQDLIELGASPRASIALYLTAKAEALMAGENYVTPQNVKDVAVDVLRHRILLTYEAEAQGLDTDEIVQAVLNGVQVP